MHDTLTDFRSLLDEEGIEVAVSDLDGVLRVFDTVPWDELDARLGLDPGAAFDAILRDPILEDATRGRAAHADWRESSRRTLRSRGVPAQRAADVVSAWADDRGRLDVDVLDVLSAAQRHGLEVFVLTNGTDRVREELEDLQESTAHDERPEDRPESRHENQSSSAGPGPRVVSTTSWTRMGTGS
jgi:putative hydrolase of the HAD superfamily